MNKKERATKKYKFEVIEGNAKAVKKVKLEEPPLYIKAAVMGSRKPDIAPINNKSNGKVSIAIDEYRKLVEENPNDILMINTLGDLYVRVGKVDEAVFLFIEIATYYYSEGYLHKSLAMYKKVSKLSPSNSISSTRIFEIETLLKLR